MIRVHRPVDEPPALAGARTQSLPIARAAFQAGTLDAATHLKGYSHARGALYAAQYGKCAYCEWQPLGIEWSPVEHFRPKGMYWWLTWTWSNLLFACQWCNSKHKGTQFPLREPATQLMPEDEPPGAEDPLTIDPAGGVNPRDHIQFVRLATWWQPIPRGGSDYGEATIRVLGLDQPPVRDRYQTFFADSLDHRIDNVSRAMAQRDEEQVRRYWAQLVETTDPRREFSAFASDVIEQAFAEDVRQDWKLTLDH